MSRLLTQEEIDALLASGPIVPAPVEHVRIVVEAGRTEISFAALAALAPGRLLTLDTPADARLEIVANGTPVAYGRLVAVDGRACIRVVSLIGPGTAQGRSSR
jgi:flagellar motor switch/type III secretory pathway protein FliN